MIRFLLDTNHLGRALHEDGEVRVRVRQSLVAGHRLGTSVPALCETAVGIRQTAHRQRNERSLVKLLDELRVWPIDLELIPIFADIRAERKAKGRAMSQIDVMIAAVARQQRAILLTTDRDFEALPDIKCENWVSA